MKSEFSNAFSMVDSRTAKKFKGAFEKYIAGAKRIVVAGHRSPDDDALMAMLAMGEILGKKTKGKQILRVVTSEPLERYGVFEGYEKINFCQDLADEVKDGDTVIFLDGSQYNRFSFKPEKLTAKKIRTVCIDHHSSPADKFDLVLIEKEAGATCNLIYQLFLANERLGKGLAKALMAGILGDTGNFVYVKKENREIFKVAEKLMVDGDINIQDLLASYRTIEPKEMEVVARLIKNTEYHQVKDWPDFQTSYINKEDVEKEGWSDATVKTGKDIYVGSFIRVIKGFSWGFVVIPKDAYECHLSLRSLPGSVSVRDIMERMQLGGGHDRTGGGSMKSENGKKLMAKEGVEKVVGWMKLNKPILR